MKRFATVPRLAALLLGTAAVTATPAQAAGPNFVGDVIVDGSLCVGFDCVVGTAFGFDTQILRENNLRIFFDDTSTAASFPPNDWRLYANDSANGGSSYFGVEDATNGRFVFRVFAGARSNALTVDSQGDVGLGTTTPATDIDIKIGDTPTVRLQQDGSNGFTPQTWDVAGNETNFFIRDATGGSALPFRIRPGAPTNSIFIDTDGDVGMGTASPDAPLHVDRQVTGANFLVEDTDGRAELHLDDGTSDPDTGPMQLFVRDDNDLFAMSFANSGVQEFLIRRNGEVEINGGNLEINGGFGLITSSGGACDGGAPCDAVFDPDVYAVPPMEEYAARMWENRHLPVVGPTGPDQPINVTEKMLRMLNALEHAHIYIDQLNGRVQALEAELAAR